MIFTNGYYHALDRTEYALSEKGDWVEQPIELTTGEQPLDKDAMEPERVGTSLNPFQHQLQALSAKIKEGAGKVEFEFFGAGKGQKERATPESFDSEERREMRELAEINEVESSTHATVAVTGLAGFDPQRGFEEQMRDQNVREIKKAVEFAADASTGGAIVVHTGEWNRPIVDHHGHEIEGGIKYEFTGYEGEEKRAPIMVIDDRTGELRAMRKDTPVYEPVFKTVEDYERENGKKVIGTRDKYGNLYEADDWIGVTGEVVKRDWEFDRDKAETMFKRVPHWNPEQTNFKTIERNWNYFLEKAGRWNERNPGKELTPEEIFAKTQYMNQVLQAKGSSLYHARFYEREKEAKDAALKALRFYEKLDESLSEEEKYKLMTRQGYFNTYSEFIPPKNISVLEHLNEIVKNHEDSMRYTHEASAAADVQATQFYEAMEHAKSLDKYGLQKSSESIAELGILAWQKYEKNKDHLKEALYIAPENWHPNQFGSHPDELLEMVDGARKEMINRLSPSLGREKAEELAQTHIKTTIDTGHLNLWKSHLKRKTDENGVPIESDEEFNKRFAKWSVEKLKKLHEAKAIGHVHLTDNFGYDDEHIHIGKGNAPVKEMVDFLTEKGYKDFIVEPGSFNPQTVLPEAWSFFGSPVYSVPVAGQAGRFSEVHKRHFGYDAPPLYIVGAYAPTNEWKIWSEVPLE